MNIVPSLKKTALVVAITGAMNGAQAQDLMLEEVVVTAQKRVESLQDVPISVSVMSAETMQEYNITDISDLSSSIPNLNAKDGTISSSIYIRGVGTGVNQGFEQSVGTFVDGTYRGRAALARTSFFDLQSVEVLRGPQGVLFGKSVIGGAISSTTAKPTEETTGKLSALVAGEYGTEEYEGIVSGTIVDGVAGRLAFRHAESDGFMKNTTTGDDQAGNNDNTVRGTVVWEATDETSITFSAEHSKFKTDGAIIQIAGENGITAAGYRFPAGNIDFSTPAEMELDLDRSQGSDEFRDTQVNNFVLTVDSTIGDNEFKSITGFSAYQYHDAIDADASALTPMTAEQAADPTYVYQTTLGAGRAAVPSVVQYANENYKQYSQEFRIVSPGGESLDWIAGAYFDYSKLDFENDTDIDMGLGQLEALADGYAALAGAGISDFMAAAAMDFGATSAGRVFKQKAYTSAAFGQATWNFKDDLRATFGLRYTYEKKEAERTVTVDKYLTSDRNTDPYAVAIWAATLGAAEHHEEDTMSDAYFTPSVNVQWDYSDDNMAYFSASKGQKSGGFDVKGNLPESVVPWEFEQEKATTYEIGTKMRLLDGAAELNAAVFYTEYKDLQTSVFDGNTGYYVKNAGKADISGVEIDGRWLIAEGLVLSGAIGYLDFGFTDFDDGPCNSTTQPGDSNVTSTKSDGVSPATCDLKDKENIYTPEWSANLGVNYSRAISEGLMMRVGATANFQDNQYTSYNLDPNSESPAYTLYDAVIAIGDIHGDWEISVIGKNLGDERQATFTSDVAFSTDAYDTYYQAVNAPRTYAVQGVYNF